MLSSKPCNASGTVKLVQLVLGRFPKINRALSTGTELELQVFEAVNVPLRMQNQNFRLCGSAPFRIHHFRNGPFNTMLTVPIRAQLRILKGQYVGIAIKGDYNGRLNIASRSTRIENKQTIYFGPKFANQIGNVVAYNGYIGSDTRGHSCVGFRISVAHDSVPLSNPTNASIPSGDIANDSAHNQYSGSPTFGRLAQKGEWKTRFCMHLNPFHADGNITSMEVQFLDSQAATKVKDFELHFFNKVFEGNTRLYRFVRKYKISQNNIVTTNSASYRSKVVLPSLNVTKGMLVGLYNPRENLRICSRSPFGPAETFLYHPQPGALKYTENNSLNVRFTVYKNTDHRGTTCPGYRLFFETETHSQLPSDDLADFAALNTRPRPQSRAEPSTERIPSSGPREQESSNAIHYLGHNPLPRNMDASWRSEYMMMDLPVKKAGIIHEIELWLGSVCMSNQFFLRVFEKLPGRNMFKQISYHPISIDKRWISSPQKAKFDFRCKVKPGQYLCLSTVNQREKLNLRSRAKNIKETYLYYNPEIVGNSFTFRKYRDKDHRGGTTSGFNVSISVSDLETIGPPEIATTTSWLSCTMTSQEMISPKDGFIHSIRMSLELPAHRGSKWELHTMKALVEQENLHDVNRRDDLPTSVTSMKMISTGRVFFQPPEFVGITTMPLDKPLKVRRGEYIALYSGNSSRPLHLHSQAEQRRYSDAGVASRSIIFGEMPRDDSCSERWDFMQGSDTQCGFQVMISKSIRKTNDREINRNSHVSILERSPSDRCALALRQFGDAQSEKELLVAIQTLANFNSAGISKEKLIQHAKWKLLSKHDVWTRDVATLFGNLLSLDVETKGKEKLPEQALQGTQNAETEMKTDVSDQALQGTQNTQNESFSNLNPSPNTHNNTVPAPQNQQPLLMNVTAPPGSQPGQIINVQTPRGIFQVAIPAGIFGGMVFRIQF